MASGKFRGKPIVIVEITNYKLKMRKFGTRKCTTDESKGGVPTSLQREGDRLGYINLNNIVQNEPNINFKIKFSGTVESSLRYHRSVVEA